MALAPDLVQGGGVLLTGDYDSASKHFNEVLDTFPGELAPKLALAATAELAGTSEERRFYETVWHTDNNIISGRLRSGARAVGRRRPLWRGHHTGRSTRRITVFHHRPADQCGHAAVRPIDPRTVRAADS